MNMLATLPPRLDVLPPDQLRKLVKRAVAAVSDSTEPGEIIKLYSMLDAAESLMHAAGMYDGDEIREVVEARMRARWKLGQLLAKMERSKGGRPKKTSDIVSEVSKGDMLEDLGLNWKDAQRAQRLGTLPEKELDRAFAAARKQDVLCTLDGLIKLARPHWYKANREAKHREIEKSAKSAGEKIGPFPLIYADPPWKFETYSEKGLEKTPDQHYPTLSDQEIIDFEVAGKNMHSLTSKRAALLLWCTSSNLSRALDVMEGWGFTYKTCAVWVKTKKDGTPWTGMGLVFRNAHELLLYGTKGSMPGPQYQPPSVFMLPRGRHSEKPNEIRKAVEKMYPNFSAKTRLELFARSTFKGWTCRGYEAK